MCRFEPRPLSRLPLIKYLRSQQRISNLKCTITWPSPSVFVGTRISVVIKSKIDQKERKELRDASGFFSPNRSPAVLSCHRLSHLSDLKHPPVEASCLSPNTRLGRWMD
jgi:hypothetical protein